MEEIGKRCTQVAEMGSLRSWTRGQHSEAAANSEEGEMQTREEKKEDAHMKDTQEANIPRKKRSVEGALNDGSKEEAEESNIIQEFFLSRTKFLCKIHANL